MQKEFCIVELGDSVGDMAKGVAEGRGQYRGCKEGR